MSMKEHSEYNLPISIFPILHLKTHYLIKHLGISNHGVLCFSNLLSKNGSTEMISYWELNWLHETSGLFNESESRGG